MVYCGTSANNTFAKTSFGSPQVQGPSLPGPKSCGADLVQSETSCLHPQSRFIGLCLHPCFAISYLIRVNRQALGRRLLVEPKPKDCRHKFLSILVTQGLSRKTETLGVSSASSPVEPLHRSLHVSSPVTPRRAGARLARWRRLWATSLRRLRSSRSARALRMEASIHGEWRATFGSGSSHADEVMGEQMPRIDLVGGGVYFWEHLI